jgi:hypothetical protein
MASSRWKRFAFFERHTLSLPSEVLEDLIPIDGTDGRSSQRSLNRIASDSHNESVSLVVTTAALPLNSKPSVGQVVEKGGDSAAVSDMWSSLTACAAMELPWEADGEDQTIRLPNQAQMVEDDSTVSSGGSAVDGLVMVFVTSRDTDFVHCFDVTVRCNPPESTEKKDLEDLDGWRGYFSPLKGHKAKPTQASSAAGPRTLEERIVSEHMEQETVEGIVGISTCRGTTGHKPVFMACITESNVVVCKDPHLYLSW